MKVTMKYKPLLVQHNLQLLQQLKPMQLTLKQIQHPQQQKPLLKPVQPPYLKDVAFIQKINEQIRRENDMKSRILQKRVTTMVPEFEMPKLDPQPKFSFGFSENKSPTKIEVKKPNRDKDIARAFGRINTIELYQVFVEQKKFVNSKKLPFMMSFQNASFNVGPRLSTEEFVPVNLQLMDMGDDFFDL